MSMDGDAYYTLGKDVSREIKIKGSRFIGSARPVDSRQDAEAFVGRLSKKYHDATHNCYAYRVGMGDASVFRYSDAGEPSGTAGRPILEAIDGRELTNTALVVTRYFGGVKLGTGGLARAYGACAAETLDAGERIQRYLMETFRIGFPHDMTGNVMNLVSAHACQVEDTVYREDVEITLRVRLSRSQRFQEELKNATRGKARIIP